MCSKFMPQMPAKVHAMKFPRTPFAIALLTAFPLLASAQLTGNVTLTANYQFRGQDQDASKARAVKPAIQGGFDYAFGGSGF